MLLVIICVMMTNGAVIGFLLNIWNTMGKVRMEPRNVLCCGGGYVIAIISECDVFVYI